MTFLEQLQSHRGGLIRLTELYWYDGQGRDGVRNRICLVLDASAATNGCLYVQARSSWSGDAVAVLLLIDGCPQWVWVCRQDAELL